MEEEIILEFKKSNNGVGVEIHEGTALEVIIGIAEFKLLWKKQGKKEKI